MAYNLYKFLQYIKISKYSLCCQHSLLNAVNGAVIYNCHYTVFYVLNPWRLTTAYSLFQVWILNTSNLKCLILCSINSVTILEWRHCNSSLIAVIQTISQRSLKKNELIYCINNLLLKNPNLNLFMCLHLENNSSRVLRTDSGSAFMIASFSVKHRSHFVVLPVYGWALQATYHWRS